MGTSLKLSNFQFFHFCRFTFSRTLFGYSDMYIICVVFFSGRNPITVLFLLFIILFFGTAEWRLFLWFSLLVITSSPFSLCFLLFPWLFLSSCWVTCAICVLVRMWRLVNQGMSSPEYSFIAWGPSTIKLWITSLSVQWYFGRVTVSSSLSWSWVWA